MKSEDLLSIDVGSELRTLCEAQLRGTWQVPAELVRFALRSGAKEIRVDWRRSLFSFRWTGGAVADGLLRQLQRVLDRDAETSIRQQGITRLESAGAEALLWAGGIRGARVRVEASGACFTHRDGGRPRLEPLKQHGAPPSVLLRWSCRRLDRKRTIRWLRLATRFVEAELLFNGVKPPRGFPGGLFHLLMERPVPARIGLTREGDEPLLWLLQDGVVSGRAAVPGYPPFEAAVELGDVVASGASSADLRLAVRPFLNDIVDRAVWMMVQVAERPDGVKETDRQRLVTLLLRAARRGLHEREIRDLPILQTADRGNPVLSLQRLEALARRRDGRFLAIDPGQEPAGLLADLSSTVVASTEVRSLVSDLTSVRFQSPPRRYETLLRKTVLWAQKVILGSVRRARCWVGSRPLGDEVLETDELRLLALLRPLMAPTRVFLGSGTGAMCSSRGQMVLPRDNPSVAIAARLVDKDPAWLYPLLLALENCDLPHQTLRNRWQNRAKSGVVNH